MSNVPVRRLTHCAMREQRFPPRQTVSVTTDTIIMHSKRVCPSKSSNPQLKFTSQASNPLRHARKTFPDTPDMYHHAFQHSHTQQNTYSTKGFEPACEKLPVQHLTHCAMRQFRFPALYTTPTTSPTTHIHSKTLHTPAGSNPQAKNTRKTT